MIIYINYYNNDIKNIQFIIREALNPEFDWDKEINFMFVEFSFLNKDDYI